jgi:hypothetical protein
MVLIHREPYATEPAVTQSGTCAPLVHKDQHHEEPPVTKSGTWCALIVHKDLYDDRRPNPLRCQLSSIQVQLSKEE